MEQPALPPEALIEATPMAALRTRLARPWLLLVASAAGAGLLARLLAEPVLGRGLPLDRTLEAAVIGAVSLGQVSAPILTMRVARRAWSRLDDVGRGQTVAQVLAQGVVAGPLLGWAVASHSELLPAQTLLGPTTVGGVLITVGSAVSLHWRRRSGR